LFEILNQLKENSLFYESRNYANFDKIYFLINFN